ncbi:MAG: elongation factor P maturation arginine rhamnosyltransferase EarP [Ottowia sp.]|nr:elongation factor P maturation arginine rhamnosyltransferase EarP [Ottowia sp.]
MQHWDIFCKVIDNYGDAGVCWRLVSQLAQRYPLKIRLWIDDLACLAKLAPEVSLEHAMQALSPHLEVHHWDASFTPTYPGDIVIEAFACDLPPCYLLAMAHRKIAPVWINLEYLSAEDWVNHCHGLASPHPELPLTKYFFFPGYTTGGLLRETDLRERQQNWYQQHTSLNNTSSSNWFSPTTPIVSDAIKISLFSYDNPALPSLLTAWSKSPAPIHCLIPTGQALDQACFFFGIAPLSPKHTHHHGTLYLTALPFVAQTHYDALLWDCDLNFVRGEDSFVRAQLAGQPMVWHIYPQQEKAHLNKLTAFLQHYTQAMPPALQQAVKQLHFCWNQGQDCTEIWAIYWDLWQKSMPLALRQHAHQWANQLYAQTDLTSQLYNFAQEKCT